MDAHTSAMECNSTKQAPQQCESIREWQYMEVRKGNTHCVFPFFNPGVGELTNWSCERCEAANNQFQHTCPDNKLASTWNSGKAECGMRIAGTARGYS